MIYQELQTGDKLQKGDEYNSSGVWREIPDFMIGDKIQDTRSTSWRRTISKNEPPEKKKGWFNL